MPEPLMPHPDELIDHEAEYDRWATREREIREASYRWPHPDATLQDLQDLILEDQDALRRASW